MRFVSLATERMCATEQISVRIKVNLTVLEPRTRTRNLIIAAVTRRRQAGWSLGKEERMRRRPPSFAASQRQVSSVESHPSKPPPYALEFLLSPCWFAHAKQIFGLSSAPSLFHATVLATHLLVVPLSLLVAPARRVKNCLCLTLRPLASCVLPSVRLCLPSVLVFCFLSRRSPSSPSRHSSPGPLPSP